MNEPLSTWLPPAASWTVGPYRFVAYSLGRARWRWECSAHGRGVGHFRTPIGAFRALRRWLNEDAAS